MSDELSYLPEWSYHSITSFIASFNFDRIHRNKLDCPPNMKILFFYNHNFIYNIHTSKSKSE